MASGQYASTDAGILYTVCDYYGLCEEDTIVGPNTQSAKKFFFSAIDHPEYIDLELYGEVDDGFDFTKITMGQGLFWYSAVYEYKCSSYCTLYGCSSHTFGPKPFLEKFCRGECNCRDGDSCEGVTGSCRKGCAAGYRGETCASRCGDGTYGFKCRYKCSAYCVSSKCHKIEGTCDCKAGYRNRKCDQSCQYGTFGGKCAGTCHCHKHSACRNTDGKCFSGKCAKGYIGATCQIKCNYGSDDTCLYRCQCASGECDAISGKCKNGCSLRYFGADCQLQCPTWWFLTTPTTALDLTAKTIVEKNKYYKSYIKTICSKECHCVDNSKCDVRTGRCLVGKCIDGYWGKSCQDRCQYGPHRACVHTCHCAKGGCDVITGKCESGCANRYFGADCQTKCPGWTFLATPTTAGDLTAKTLPVKLKINKLYLKSICTKECHCVNNEKCDVRNGECLDGGCILGYWGKSCQERCQYGPYGPCLHRCHCSKGGCDRVKGTCEHGCGTRFFGADCQGECPEWTFLTTPTTQMDLTASTLAHKLEIFGSSFWNTTCSKTCHCLNNKKCDIRTGTCLSGGCVSGYRGETCQEPCNGTTFGRMCLKYCHCKEGGSCAPATGVCSTGCHHRWTGFSCQTTCQTGNYLMKGQCHGVCRCLKNAECSVEMGICRNGGCIKGWQGADCQQKCSSGKFGLGCQNLCHCDQGKPCHHVNGSCLVGCAVRYTAKNCSLTCPDNTWSVATGCDKTCLCKFPKYCRVTDGLCTQGGCASEYLGKCILGCPPGRYDAKGSNCTLHCHCKYQANCDPLDGKCPSGCSVRYTGDSCQKTCPDGKYGISKNPLKVTCKETCACKDAADCRVTDGRCEGPCHPGYVGFKCKTKCTPGLFGEKCLQKCHCLKSAECDHVTGRCAGACTVRYYGTYCSKTCSLSFYLINGKCDGSCHCFDQRDCNVTDGTCGAKGCLHGYTGQTCQTECVKSFGRSCEKDCHCAKNAQCDTRNGFCVYGCQLRYTGDGCQRTCAAGRFGPPACTNVCGCRNARQCNVVSGRCMAGLCRNPRMSRPMCQKGCPAGKYLIKGICSGECRCHIPKMCLVDSGICMSGTCKAGWIGRYCNQKCPKGKFGVSCARSCRCKFNQVCSHDYGECPGGCEEGYTGMNCQQKKDLRTFSEGVGIWAGTVFAIVFIAVVIGYVARIFQRRRKREEMKMITDIKEMPVDTPGTVKPTASTSDVGDLPIISSPSAAHENHPKSTASHASQRSRSRRKSHKKHGQETQDTSMANDTVASVSAMTTRADDDPTYLPHADHRSRSRRKSSKRRGYETQDASMADDTMASVSAIMTRHDDDPTYLSHADHRSRSRRKSSKLKRETARDASMVDVNAQPDTDLQPNDDDNL